MKLEEQLRHVMRLRHYSLKTEESYVGWYRRFIFWHGKKHPTEMGSAEVEAFLTYLAVDRQVAASTQNQALSALLFLYKEVLDIELEGVNAKRAKTKRNLPVVLTKEETSRLLHAVHGETGLLSRLLYGCGLRVNEGLRLRVKDVDLEGGKVEIRDGKEGERSSLDLAKSIDAAITGTSGESSLVVRGGSKSGSTWSIFAKCLDRKNASSGGKLGMVLAFSVRKFLERPA